MTTNPYGKPAWADPPTMEEIKRQMAVQDARMTKPGYWKYIDGQRWTAICICGHPIPRHGKPGEYAYCLAKAKCECGGGQGSRVVLYTRGDLRAFNRSTRGSGQPHAFNGAVEKIAEKDLLWDATECDDCGSSAERLLAVALDEQDRPMIKRPKESDRPLDTGHHKLLCETCWEEARDTPVENNMQTLGMNEELVDEQLRLYFEKVHGRLR